MKTKYYNYLLWEDWQNGMYKQVNDNSEERIFKAVDLFKNKDELYNAMKYVAFNWKISAEVNFTNPSINYQAWLGQASQCYKNNCSDTRIKDGKACAARVVADGFKIKYY